MKALIVDDERIICDGLAAMIPWQSFGFDAPETAANGVQALEKMAACPFDLLITDVQMPLMDGLALCRKANELYPDCTLVILSGYGDFQYAQQAIEYGVRSYLLKPVDENKLMAILEQLRERESNDASSSDAGYYDAALPFSGPAELSLSSAAEYGRESVRRLAKGASALHVLESFVRSLMASKPDREQRASIISDYLQPQLQAAEELNAEEESGWKEDALRSCVNASDLADLYEKLSAFMTRLADFMNSRLLLGGSRASDAMVAYIRERYASKITAAGIAEHFHLSPAYCGRLFKEEQGISILQYLHKERIAQAKKLLTDTDDKLEYIALQVGYSEISGFYAQFKRIMNMTPEQYRKLSRKS